MKSASYIICRNNLIYNWLFPYFSLFFTGDGNILRKNKKKAWRGPEGSKGWDSQISRQSALEGDKVVSPRNRPPLPQEIFLVLIYIRGSVNLKPTVRPEGLCQWKIPMTPSGFEPATFLLVAQCLNRLRHQQRAPIIAGTCDKMSVKWKEISLSYDKMQAEATTGLMH